MGPQEQPQVPEQAPQPTNNFQAAPQPAGSFPNTPQSPMTPPMPMPKKGMSKGLLFGIIGGVVGLMLLIVGIILALVFFGGPNRSDYNKAGTTYDTAVTAYNELGLKSYDLTSSSSTATTRKNTIDSMKGYQSDFNSKFEEAGKMKGIANDKELKVKWDAANAKREKFNSSLTQLYEIADKVTPVLEEISELSSPTVSQLKELELKVEGIKVANTATSDYLTELAKYMKAAVSYYEYRNSDTYDSTAYTRYSAAENAYYDASKNWSSSIDKMSSEVELKNELNALRDALMEKSLR